MNALYELAIAAPDAAATYVASEPVGSHDATDAEEWVTDDAATARRLGAAAVLRVAASALVADVPLEVIIRDEDDAHALLAALDGQLQVRAALASGDTGIEVYRAAAIARRVLGGRVPIRARWDGPLDVKGAALALTFGADELAGPMAPPKERWKLAQVGGPAEDGGRPSPAFVESLIRAAGRSATRRAA
jgi:hypothetical protein